MERRAFCLRFAGITGIDADEIEKVVTEKEKLHEPGFIWWAYEGGFATKHWHGKEHQFCYSCKQHVKEKPLDTCRCPAFHSWFDTRLRYSRLPRGPRKYFIDKEGNPPEGIYTDENRRPVVKSDKQKIWAEKWAHYREEQEASID